MANEIVLKPEQAQLEGYESDAITELLEAEAKKANPRYSGELVVGVMTGNVPLIPGKEYQFLGERQ